MKINKPLLMKICLLISLSFASPVMAIYSSNQDGSHIVDGKLIARVVEGNNIIVDQSITLPDGSLAAAKIATISPVGDLVFVGLGGVLTSLPYSPANASIQNSDIQDGTIQSVDIQDNAITEFELQDGSITTRILKNNDIFAIDFADASVSATKIVDASLLSNNFADNAVSTAKIQDQAIDEDKLQSTAVLDQLATGMNIVAGTVDATNTLTQAMGFLAGNVIEDRSSVINQENQVNDILNGTVVVANASLANVVDSISPDQISDAVGTGPVLFASNGELFNANLGDETNITEHIIFEPSTQPAAQVGLMYFDSVINKLRISEDGTSFVTVSSAGAFSDPDWLINGNDLSLGLPGNLGIGVSNPQEKVDIDGTLNADAFIGDGSQLFNLAFEADGWTSDDNITRLTNNSDSVVIGNTSPVGKLHVLGDLDVSNGDIKFVSDEDDQVHNLQLNQFTGMSFSESNPVLVSQNAGKLIFRSEGDIEFNTLDNTPFSNVSNFRLRGFNFRGLQPNLLHVFNSVFGRTSIGIGREALDFGDTPLQVSGAIRADRLVGDVSNVQLIGFSHSVNVTPTARASLVCQSEIGTEDLGGNASDVSCPTSFNCMSKFVKTLSSTFFIGCNETRGGAVQYTKECCKVTSSP